MPNINRKTKLKLHFLNRSQKKKKFSGTCPDNFNKEIAQKLNTKTKIYIPITHNLNQ